MPAVPSPPEARLPDGFALRLDPATDVRDDGAALLGGSPLRLLRLSPTARGLLDGDRLVVRDASTAALAARLLDAGVAHPAPATDPDAAPQADSGEVTVVVPVRDRTAGVARLLAALRVDPGTCGARIVVVDDGSADPAALAAVARYAGAEVVRHETARGPAAARNAGLREVRTELVAFLDSDCVPRPGWLGVLRRHLRDPRLAVVAPRIVALPVAHPGWAQRYEAAAGALDMGGRPAVVRPLSAVSYLPSAALLARREALGDGFDEAMPVAEDVDLVWRLAAAGWRVRYEPAAEVAHEHPVTTAAWLRRRAFYGTGAALLAARHGGAVAPVVMAPQSAAVWVLVLAAGPRRRRPLLGAAGLLALATLRLARRLAGPGGPPPLGLSARLVAGGTASAAGTLARAATRHHWPVAAAVAVVSRRARRLLLAAAVADAARAWWPHRRAVGPVAFAAARRLDDLAYGAGLWAGAVRARDPRALLPRRPPAP